MIFCLIITTPKGDIIFSKYFDPALDLETVLSWEKSLFHLTHSSWEESKNAQQIVVTEHNKEEQFIILQAVDEVIFFVAGQGDDNEISLSLLLTDIIALIRSLIVGVKKPINDAALVSNYDKLCLYMEEVIMNGCVNQLDKTAIEQFYSLKFDAKKEKKDK